MIAGHRLDRRTSVLIIANIVLLIVLLAMVGVIIAAAVASRGWLALPAVIFFAGVLAMFAFTLRDTVAMLRRRD